VWCEAIALTARADFSRHTIALSVHLRSSASDVIAATLRSQDHPRRQSTYPRGCYIAPTVYTTRGLTRRLSFHRAGPTALSSIRLDNGGAGDVPAERRKRLLDGDEATLHRGGSLRPPARRASRCPPSSSRIIRFVARRRSARRPMRRRWMAGQREVKLIESRARSRWTDDQPGRPAWDRCFRLGANHRDAWWTNQSTNQPRHCNQYAPELPGLSDGTGRAISEFLISKILYSYWCCTRLCNPNSHPLLRNSERGVRPILGR